MNHTRRGPTLAILLGFAGSGLAAVTMPHEGNFDFNYCMAGKVDYTELRTGFAIGQFEGFASMYANSRAPAFDHQASRCIGAHEIVNGNYHDYAVCLQVDADGDKWLLHFDATDTTHGNWTAVEGSGKYQGMSAKAI